jgi:hypothetical protein
MNNKHVPQRTLKREYDMAKINSSEIIIYQTEDGQTKIDVRMEDETVWLSLDKMAELF